MNRRHVIAGAAAGLAAIASRPMLSRAEAQTSTNWSDPASWPNGVPGPTSVAVIDTHMVLDVDALVAGVKIMPGGRLTFGGRGDRLLESTGNVEVYGRLVMRPTSLATHTLRFVGVNEAAFAGGGMDPVASDVGLWVVDDGQLDAVGSVRKPWTRLLNGAKAGEIYLYCADTTGWAVGDRVAIAPTSRGGVAVELATEADAREAGDAARVLTVDHEADVAALEGVDADLGASLAGKASLVDGLVPPIELPRQALNPFTDLREFGSIDVTGVSDATAVINLAMQGMYDAGGGILVWPKGVIRIDGQLILPHGNPTVNGAFRQPATIWQGHGGYFDGQNGAPANIAPFGGTRLLLRYQGPAYNDAKIVTRGLGTFSPRDMIFQDDTALSETPFLYSTLTTIHPRNCAFIGKTGNQDCRQDAIVLGGKTKPPDATVGWDDPDVAFQGYGSVIQNCYFNQIRRMVYGRSYCNQVIIRDNFTDKRCGTNLPGGACIEFDGGLDPNQGMGNKDTMNVITGTYFEWTGGYTYQVKLINCADIVVFGNGGVDPGPSVVALVRCEGVTVNGTNYNTVRTRIFANHQINAVYLSEDALSALENEVLFGSASNGNNLLATTTFGKGNRIRNISSAKPGWEFINSSGQVVCTWLNGSGTPEGVISPSVGSFYTRRDGGAGTTLYVKESGTGVAGWVAK